MKKNKDELYQIEVSKGKIPTSGKYVIQLIELILQLLPAKYLVINDLDGAIGEKLYQMRLPKIMNLKTFKEVAKNTFQFDWGDFYLFDKKSEATKLKKLIEKIAPHKDFYYKTIPFALTTVRVFDDWTLIVYTNRKEIFSLVKKHYANNIIPTGLLVEGGKISDLRVYS